MSKIEDDFFGKDYKEPEGNFMKLQDGENTFRVLSKAVTGHEYWNKDGKPIRAKEPWTTTPADIQTKVDAKGNEKTTAVKHFWVFAVWNHKAGKVQVLEITQKSIRTAMKAYITNEKWGDPKTYDFTITRSGSGLDTEYVTMANPHSEAPKADISGINLQAIFEADGDIFAPVAEVKKAE